MRDSARGMATTACALLFGLLLTSDTRSKGASQTLDTERIAHALFGSLHGTWTCDGAFASGDPLAAILEFAPTADRRGLRYRHIDHAPNTYSQEAIWAFDAASTKVTSLALISVGSSGPTSVGLYVADELSERSIRIEARPLLSDPWAPNRFTYTLDGDSLRMVWERERDGEWKMGDYLNCVRAGSARS